MTEIIAPLKVSCNHCRSENEPHRKGCYRCGALLASPAAIGELFTEFAAIVAPPESRPASGSSVIVAAILICLTMIFWPDLRHLVVDVSRYYSDVWAYWNN